MVRTKSTRLDTTKRIVEFSDQLIRQRAAEESAFTTEDFRAAIIVAGQQRFTPIFLTTATTVGGLIPLATAGGPLWVGMAWLLIFGLMFATLLTLFIIPVLYSFGGHPPKTSDGRV